MTTMTEERKELRVNGLIVTVIVGVITASIIGGATALVDTRERLARIDQRVLNMEQDHGALRALPGVIARLEAKVDNLTDEVNKLRAERRR